MVIIIENFLFELKYELNKLTMEKLLVYKTNFSPFLLTVKEKKTTLT